MWSERYEKLSSYEQGEFRRLGNYLLNILIWYVLPMTQEKRQRFRTRTIIP